MKNKRGILILGAIILIFILSLYFDSSIIESVSYIKNNSLDSSLLWLTSESFEIVSIVILTGIFFLKRNGKKLILPLWFSLALSALSSFILKIVIERPRPFQQGLIEISSSLIQNSYYVWDFSFPSNHTIIAFCAVPFLSKEFPKLKYVWIALACIVGFSRIYFGLHFLSDVIAGAALGYLIGALVIKAEKENHFWENLYQRIYNRFVR